MAEDRKKGDREKEKGGIKDAKERRRMGLFAWLGPMLERREPRVEKVDEEEFDDRQKKK